jgi:hypothetical protein
MRLPQGAYYKIKTNASGKRVRLTISSDGRILDSELTMNKTRRTKVGKRLERRRRRIR